MRRSVPIRAVNPAFAARFDWAAAWALLYRNPEFRTDIESAPTDTSPRPGILYLALRRPYVAYILAGMYTGPVWWFYLFWVTCRTALF